MNSETALSVSRFGLGVCSVCPCRRGGRAFLGPGSFGSVVVKDGCAFRGKVARRRCQAVTFAAALRQVASMRRRSWRVGRARAKCSTIVESRRRSNPEGSISPEVS